MKQRGLPSLQKKIKKVFPNQFICEEKANGVVCNGNFYPYKISYGSANVIGKVNTRYFVSHVILSICVTPGTPASIALLRTVGDKFLAYLAATNSDVCTSLKIGILLDIREGFYPSELDAARWEIIVYYCEIDVLPGELNPKVIEE